MNQRFEIWHHMWVQWLIWWVIWYGCYALGTLIPALWTFRPGWLTRNRRPTASSLYWRWSLGLLGLLISAIGEVLMGKPR